MNRPAIQRALTGLGLAALLPLCAHAQTIYLNETFETDTVGVAPTDSALYRTALVTVVGQTAPLTSGNAARFLDDSTSAGGILEYNAGSSGLSSLFLSFDVANNAPDNTGSAANPLIFSAGNWNDSSAVRLNANGNRAFGLEIYQTGETGNLRIRVGGSTVHSGTYAMGAVNNFKIFINDDSTTTLDYLAPGAGLATLAANSVAIYMNDSLLGGGSIGLNEVASAGYVIGDSTLGRFGFNTSSTGLADFLIDNVYASSVSAVPEPSSCAALAGLGVLGLAGLRRRRRHA